MHKRVRWMRRGFKINTHLAHQALGRSLSLFDGCGNHLHKPGQRSCAGVVICACPSFRDFAPAPGRFWCGHDQRSYAEQYRSYKAPRMKTKRMPVSVIVLFPISLCRGARLWIRSTITCAGVNRIRMVGLVPEMKVVRRVQVLTPTRSSTGELQKHSSSHRLHTSIKRSLEDCFVPGAPP